MRRLMKCLPAVLVLAACSDSLAPPTVPLLSPVPQAAVLTIPSTATDLGAGYPTAINASGVVVGQMSVETGGQHAFRWTSEGGFTDLGTLPGGTSSAANAINDAGQVVGQSTGSGFSAHAFLWTPGGGMQDLGVLGGSYSLAYDINSHGVVVGESSVPDELNVNHAFIWSPEDGMREIGSLGGSQTVARAINDDGLVAGWYFPHDSEVTHGFVWTEDGGFTDIGSLGGDFTEVRDINNRGEVVGLSKEASGAIRAFIWTAEGGMQSVPDLMGSTALYSINNKGEGTGRRPGPGGYRSYFMTAEHDVIVLGTLGGTYSIGNAINDAGQVVGTAALPSGEAHGALWTLNLAVDVSVDVRPGDGGNTLNVKQNGKGARSGGVLPVALLADGSIDVADVDIASVRLGDLTPVAERGHDHFMASLEDVNDDGDLDLMLHFDLAALLANGDLDATTEQLCLTGEVEDGTRFKGCDSVRVIGG